MNNEILDICDSCDYLEPIAGYWDNEPVCSDCLSDIMDSNNSHAEQMALYR